MPGIKKQKTSGLLKPSMINMHLELGLGWSYDIDVLSVSEDLQVSSRKLFMR